MIKGSCLCGAIRYEITDVPKRMNICHCSMCRKITGSAYGVFAHIKSSKFRWIEGESSVRRYESSPGVMRSFCPKCGASVPSCNENYACIPAGTFDSDPQVKPTLQIFAGSKAPWHNMAADPVAYDEYDPDYAGEQKWS